MTTIKKMPQPQHPLVTTVPPKPELNSPLELTRVTDRAVPSVEAVNSKADDNRSEARDNNSRVVVAGNSSADKFVGKFDRLM
jgi:hypothetical protein